MQKHIGHNRTGVIGSSWKETPEPEERAPAATLLAKARVDEAAKSDRIGSVPAPRTFTGITKTVVAAILGQSANVLMDKLGQRAAFERTGVRLYEALLSKYDAYGSFPGGPMREELDVMRVEELRHYHLAIEAIESVGGDPSAMTPAADRDGNLAGGLLRTVTDPRTSLAECLEAVLAAELVDNDGWTQLIEVATRLRQLSLAAAFTKALAQEAGHLKKVRGWVSSHLQNEASGKTSEEAAPL